jgi:hypothetical protein
MKGKGGPQRGRKEEKGGINGMLYLREPVETWKQR